MFQSSGKICAVINPVSGVGSKDKIREMLVSRGVEVEILTTEYAGHASVLTRKAVDEGVQCVIAVGGDGTVNEVACSLLNTDVTLGIIPKGSGNGLARELCIPFDVRKALDVIFDAHITVIDACKANEHPFFCTCGLGFDATVSEVFAKAKRRGSLTYLKNIVTEYLNYKPAVYELSIGNQTIREKAFLIACANASQYGNNAYIAPHADICDGQMDVIMLAPFTYFDVGPLAFQLFTKTINLNSKIKTFCTSEAIITREHEGFMHIDGEPVSAGREIIVSIIPKALKVATPAVIPFAHNAIQRFNDIFGFFE
ncbi:MAG: diacylglycerol kinase family lipid kinase [Tannerella sp.]|jgi:YegS/Rv2252/BmrU family lipid kinase|nr:diacylglycerol kinase family lipid kinase [Tannerella sp.]